MPAKLDFYEAFAFKVYSHAHVKIVFKDVFLFSKVALDGRLKGDDTSLASSTLLADENNKDIFGLVISYSVRVKLFLGAIGGDLTAELPFVLMHPRPNLHKLIKADTVGAVLSSIDDPEQDENIIFPSSAENNFEMKNLLTHRATKKTE